MDQATHNKIVSFIWGIGKADWLLKGEGESADPSGYETGFTRHYFPNHRRRY